MKNKNQDEWRYSNIVIQNSGENEIIDLVRTSYKPACHIKRVSKTQYMTGAYNKYGDFVSDGVVYDIATKENHMRNRRSLRQIFRTLRQLIAHNFSGGDSELFVTLTYAEQHNDPEKIYKDLDLFWRRLKYKYPALKYIAIVEPHASGMFHIHLLLANTTGEYLYIDNSEMEQIWGNGYTSTERLNDIDNMGAYFIAYFTNMELTPDEIKIYAEDDDIEYKNGKAYIKGKRLDYYPEHMRIYRHSKNCDYPVKLTDNEIGNALENKRKTYSHETKFTDKGNEYTILTEQYKKTSDNDKT